MTRQQDSTTHPDESNRFVIIKQNSRGRIEFDQTRGMYTKFFSPRPLDLVKCWLGMRRYPGLQFARMAKQLHQLGIGVPEVVAADRFSVSTKALPGRSLMAELLTDNEENLSRYLTMYANLLATTLKAGIFFGDAHFRNYLVCSGQLYALDLDNYRIDRLPLLSRRRRIRQMMERQLPAHAAKLQRRALKTGKAAVIDAVRRQATATMMSRLLEDRLANREK